MKQYVKDFADDCIRELTEFENFAFSIADQYGKMTDSQREEIKKEYGSKKKQIESVLELCELGYLTDFEAVKKIASV